jgi:NAD(P)-dependent dehydrogenase (short-subunit alcohol dehydrogenase family)
VTAGHPRRTGDLKVDLKGLRALITGGSRGIAAAIAESFAQNGADIAFSFAAAADAAAGKPDVATSLERRLGTHGNRVFALEADLALPGAARQMARSAIETLGGIDILVLSASVQHVAHFLDMTPDKTAEQLQINIVAAIDILQVVLPGMRQQHWGRIITLGSVQETAPSTRMPVYAMTKGAQENLVRTLAYENGPFGITVNNIAPGLTDTDRAAGLRAKPELWRAMTDRANPVGRVGHVDYMAAAALYLASDGAAFVTGETINVAGGAQLTPAVDALRT